MIDHAFMPAKDPQDQCCHYTLDGLSICGASRAHHAGHSPLGDGPVRSTVERQQERITELEAANARLTEERENALDMGERYQQRIQELENLNLQLQRNMEAVMLGDENVHAENARLTARLNHLDTLAREVSERVTRLMGVVLDA